MQDNKKPNEMYDELVNELMKHETILTTAKRPRKINVAETLSLFKQKVNKRRLKEKNRRKQARKK